MTNVFTPSLPSGKSLPFEIRTDLLIGDGWSAGTGGARIPVLDPSTGDVLTTIANGGTADALAAVDAAHDAAKSWADTAPRARADILMAAFNNMIENREALAELLSLENGKAMSYALGEIGYAAEFFRWYAEEAVHDTGELSTSPGGANNILVQYEPIGVSLLITPWNLPAAMVTRKVAPALAAGCTCILKPSEETPLTAFAIAQILLDAGLPAGVLNVITTTDPGPVASAILHDPRARKVSFTGSTPVGRKLIHESADQVISASMELGGNAPFVVLDDADLDAAVSGAIAAKMQHGGESCIAANRFIVQSGIHDAFVEALTARMGAIRVGPGTAADTQLGAMINKAAIRKIDRLVEAAKSEGAKVHVGGRPIEGSGFFYPATVLSDIDPKSEFLKEEIFGPVASIVRVDTVEEAIATANATEFGLGAYLYTGDLKRGLQLSRQIESGMIGLNRAVLSDPAGPFGGVKQSGLGREGAHHGLREFMEAKYIAVEW